MVVVLGRDARAVLGAVRAVEPSALEGVLVALNPAPERGLATSLRLGFGPGAAAPVPAGVLFLLADQPRVRASVLRELCAGRVPAGTIAVAPRYSGDAAPNPVLLLPAGWPLVAGVVGDRGLGPLLAADCSIVETLAHARSAGFALSLLVLFFYYGLVALGISLGRRQLAMSAVAPWIPNVAGLVAAVALWRRLNRV